jgi:hypothetical protein
MKNIEIKKSEFSDLTKGTRGTSSSSLSEKFNKVGYGIVFMIKHKDEILKVKFSKNGNILIPEEDYLRLAKEAEKRKVDKLEIADIANNLSQSVYEDYEKVKIELKTINEDISTKLNLIETLEKSIALNSKKMEEMMNGIEKFYKDKINYETDLKKIYQDNLDIIIKQTNTIVSATKVIIDKSEKQQNYETELVECRKKVAAYEEKLKKGMFYNFLSSKK